MIDNKQVQDYHRDGFLFVKQFFTTKEIDLLYQTATDDTVVNNAFDLNDQEGKKTKLTLWFTAGDDPFGLMSRCKRMVDSVQSLLFQSHAKGTSRWRGMGMASRLWVLV
jgi:hypothetical protein